MDHSGGPEMQVQICPEVLVALLFHLLVGRKRASMDLWLTATERNNKQWTRQF